MTRKTFALGLNPDDYARVFGAKDGFGPAGRSRLCKVCGGWHRADQPWPHNCRAEAAPRSHLAAPRLSPKFEPFKPNMLTDTVINDPRSKRDYMERHDLVEYDEGVKPPPEPTEREWQKEWVADFKRAKETDPLAIEPVDVVGRTDLDGTSEVDISTIEVAK